MGIGVAQLAATAVAEVPVAGVEVARIVVAELHGQRRDAAQGIGCESGLGRLVNGAGRRQGDGIGAGRAVGMVGLTGAANAPVAEVPQVGDGGIAERFGVDGSVPRPCLVLACPLRSQLYPSTSGVLAKRCLLQTVVNGVTCLLDSGIVETTWTDNAGLERW